MDELNYKKIRAAAVAGWWTLLVGVIFATVVWLWFLCMMRNTPAWLLALWGEVPRETVINVAVWIIGVFKLVLWTMFLLVIWLSIWARKLRKMA